MKTVKIAFLILLPLALTTKPAFSQGRATVNYLSTGIGLEERIPQDGYSVKLVFSEKAGGSLTTKVAVKIYQSNKLIFSVEEAGPWLFVDLPPGVYSVSAKRNEIAQSATFEAPARGQQRVILSWP